MKKMMKKAVETPPPPRILQFLPFLRLLPRRPKWEVEQRGWGGGGGGWAELESAVSFLQFSSIVVVVLYVQIIYNFGSN